MQMFINIVLSLLYDYDYDYDLVTGSRQHADNDPGGYNTNIIIIYNV